jgi:plasmid stability protein
VSQILVRDIDPLTLEQLKDRAKRNRRSLQAEVKVILEEVANRERRRMDAEEFLRIADRIRLTSGPQISDSVDLIREDRDR